MAGLLLDFHLWHSLDCSVIAENVYKIQRLPRFDLIEDALATVVTIAYECYKDV